MFTTNGFQPYVTDGKPFAANNIVAVDLGLTFNLGKTGWSKAVSLEDYEALSAEACSKLAALRSQLKAEQDENARLRDLLAKQPTAPQTVTEKIVTSSAASVFFDINSSRLNSKKDLINIESIATAAKNSGAKVVVTGSADSKTGSSAYNQKLSEARAQAVADELVNLGVERSKIEVKGVGGVNDVAPYNLNRRAVIELK
jgi:outer membrane protein OmpA-like peptidoglycan-associated protein